METLSLCGEFSAHRTCTMNHAVTTGDCFTTEKSVTALQTMPLFGVVQLKLFFSNFFTNEDPKGFKHF